MQTIEQQYDKAKLLFKHLEKRLPRGPNKKELQNATFQFYVQQLYRYLTLTPLKKEKIQEKTLENKRKGIKKEKKNFRRYLTSIEQSPGLLL